MKKHRILIIDDSAETLDLLELFLYKDYDVYTAMNGFDGLKISREKEIDLIITDIMMPAMDGIMLLNNLQKNEKTANIPVIAVTSFVKQITKKSLTNLGFKGIITKPVNRKKLLDTVENVLSNTKKLNDET
ncbi:MAG: response regulator [Chitinispirillaceae bacterium]|nr:response regulator [Chitinispirillaceae bacterium]